LRKKLVLIGLAITAATAIAAVAFAAVPATVTLTGSSTPAKGGTKKKPKSTSVKMHFDVNKESQSTLSRIVFGLPSKISINTSHFPVCTADTINATGESSCPKGSKVGTGAATAILGSNPGTELDFSVNIYAAGKNALALFLHTNLFDIAIPATTTAHTVGFDIPQRVQQPVPNGPYSYVTSVDANLGPAKGKTTGKGKHKKKHYLLTRTGCSTSDKNSVTLSLANNPNPPAQPTLTASSPVTC
jgi:hypothetical protein